MTRLSSRAHPYYHERFNGAGSAILYLKLNAMGLDFMAEDPATGCNEARSHALLQEKTNEELLQSAAEVSRRLRKVSRHYTRLNWTTTLHAYVGERSEFVISEEDLDFILTPNGVGIIRNVLLEPGVAERDLPCHAARIRRLAELGAIDLVD